MPITPDQLRHVAQLADDHGLRILNLVVGFPYEFTVTIGGALPDGCTDIVTGEWAESCPDRQFQSIAGTIDGIRLSSIVYRDTPRSWA